MRQIKTDIEKLVHDEFGDELDAKDREIEEKEKELETKNNEINELNQYRNKLKNKLKELNELKDFNIPEAKQIIQSMMLL